MKRRDFLKGSVLSAAATSIGCSANSSSSKGAPAIQKQKKVKWRLASSFPRSLDTIFGAAEVLSQRVEAMSDGQFTIRVHPAGELVPGLQVLDAVQQGTAHCGQSASYYYTGKNPALTFDTCVPFGMTARQQEAWLHEGGGSDLVNALFADFGVRSFPGGNTGVQMGGWFKKEVPTLADLQGLKMRIPGMGGDVMAALGVSVQQIAGGEIFPALERGVIDATEWVGPYDDEKLGFHKAARFYYYPGWWEPGPSLSFYANEKAWAELPSHLQAIFRTACQDAAQAMQARYDVKNPPAFERLLQGGVQLRPFASDIMKGAQEAARQILSEQASKDPGYRKVYEAWEASRKAQAKWFGTAELAYAQFVFA